MDTYVTGWTTAAINGLDASDFALIDMSQPDYIDASAHPDFSLAADPINFGFLTANNQTVGYNAYVEDAGYDNFQVTIASTQVPEPLSVALFGAAFACLVLRRGRRVMAGRPG